MSPGARPGRPAAPADGILCRFATCRVDIEPASMRADALLEAGDLDGDAMYRRVLRAVENLQGTEPGPEGPVP